MPLRRALAALRSNLGRAAQILQAQKPNADCGGRPGQAGEVIQYRFVVSKPEQQERLLILQGRKAWAPAKFVSVVSTGCTPFDKLDGIAT
tara:strand:- start:2436 stop:2705 length:270 start_codon:yes stop_codon:yes gene_type:complete